MAGTPGYDSFMNPFGSKRNPKEKKTKSKLVAGMRLPNGKIYQPPNPEKILTAEKAKLEQEIELLQAKVTEINEKLEALKPPKPKKSSSRSSKKKEENESTGENS